MAIEPDATDAETDEVAQRLEAALDRIAAAGQRPAPARPAPDADTTAIAAQLDRMIDRLRDELAADAQN